MEVGGSMPKIKIKVDIKNEEKTDSFQTQAIIANRQIKYIEPSKTIVILDYEKQYLYRENDSIRMNYNFKEEQAFIELKDYNRKMQVPLKTRKYEKKDNDVKIEFLIDNQLFLYQVEERK